MASYAPYEQSLMAQSQGAYMPPPYYAAGQAAYPQVAYGQPAYAQPAYAQPVMEANGSMEELRTVFITNWPADTKERELNNLCRFIPHYEASQMHFRNGHVQGFALFSTGTAARTAVECINNLVFDDAVVLRAELAHKNMYVKDELAAVKRSRPTFEGGASAAAPPPGMAYAAASMPYPAGAPPAGLPGTSPSMPGAPGMVPAAAAGLPPGVPPSAYTYATSMPTNARLPPVAPCGYEPVTNARDNPPCNTLFIGNLGDHTSEAELRGLFSHQAGFQQLKLVRGPKGLSCFIEFGDVPTASACHDSQQGAILQTNDRGGIRIQFSKNPFGRKRDASGNPVQAEALGAPAAQWQQTATVGANGATATSAPVPLSTAAVQQPQANNAS